MFRRARRQLSRLHFLGGVAEVTAAGAFVGEEMDGLVSLREDGDGDGDVVMVGCKEAGWVEDGIDEVGLLVVAVVVEEGVGICLDGCISKMRHGFRFNTG